MYYALNINRHLSEGTSIFESFVIQTEISHCPKNVLASWTIDSLIEHSGKSLFFPKTSVAIVILFWLEWAGYLAMAGLNLLAQLSDRISPYGV